MQYPLRPPAVAGRFYPDDSAVLSGTIDGFLAANPTPQAAIGLVAPHAGYIYSGHVAGAIYSRIAIPARVIILCPNHTGKGVPLSIMRRGSWQTPLGSLDIDSEMSDALLAADSDLEDDFEAHRWEHAIEVQLPFLQSLQARQSLRKTALRFVAIAVGVSNWNILERLGQIVAATVGRIDRNTLIIASSDMNHYESDAVTRMKDAKAIEPLLRLDARELHDVVRREKISMCGAGPATAMIVAAKILGATWAELVQYATSADVSKDFNRVVGYAGILVA